MTKRYKIEQYWVYAVMLRYYKKWRIVSLKTKEIATLGPDFNGDFDSREDAAKYLKKYRSK